MNNHRFSMIGVSIPFGVFAALGTFILLAFVIVSTLTVAAAAYNPQITAVIFVVATFLVIGYVIHRFDAAQPKTVIPRRPKISTSPWGPRPNPLRTSMRHG
jgi:hypothetical protein